MKNILILFVIFAIPFHLFAQSINEQDVKAKQRLRELTAELDYCLQRLIDCQITNTTRFQYRSDAINLFVGKGEPMMINGSKAEEIKVEVISGNRPITTRPLKAYFSYLINGFENYAKIELVDSEVYEMIPSETKNVSENLYQFKAKHYKCLSDFYANRSEIVTITQPICICCECEEFFRFGNIKVRAITRR